MRDAGSPWPYAVRDMRDVDVPGRLTVPPGIAAWAIAAFAAFLPFLLVTVPPLADAPGHLAQLVIQAAPAGSPLQRYFDFHWGLRLNLGVDLFVEVMRHALGVQRAFWLAAALIPPLTITAIFCLARRTPHPAAAAWALPFAYSYPFSFGFLNFCLGMALTFLAFALWLRLADRPRIREALFWLIVPALLVVHAVGGGLLPVMIVAAAAGRLKRLEGASLRAFLVEVRPVAAALPLLLAWKLNSGTEGGTGMVFDLAAKPNAVLLALRDQNRAFDIASIAAILAIPWAGRLLGARYRRADGAIVLALLILFLAAPNELDGSSYIDTRLLPAVAIAALALQDWSAVPQRWRAIAAWGGLALFAVRMAVTASGFAAYAQAYAAERPALAHIAPGSRVLALVTRQCRSSRMWRMDRLDHFPALAIVERASWTNALWDVPAIHLAQIRYRPAVDFYHDPSHYVWPGECAEGQPVPRTAAERDNFRRTIDQSVALLPLDQIDYLWLVQVRLPRQAASGRLVPVWSNGTSSLYRVVAAIPPAGSAPH